MILHTWTGRLPPAILRGRKSATQRHVPGRTLGAMVSPIAARLLPYTRLAAERICALPLTSTTVWSFPIEGKAIMTRLFGVHALPLAPKASTPVEEELLVLCSFLSQG